MSHKLQVKQIDFTNVTYDATETKVLVIGDDGVVYWTDSAGGDYIFTEDLTVSLSGGKSWGKFIDGDVIPSTGMSTSEVIKLALVESLAPNISLTSSSTVQFNQTAISNTLNFSYTITSLGATVDTCVLEWRRGGSGGWTTLSTSTTTPGSYVHSLTDSAYNTAAFNYQYTVTDTSGGVSTATKNITPVAYAAPSISLSVVGVSVTSPETNTKRERGNINTNLSGTITRNSNYVNLTTYQLQYRKNYGSWVNIGAPISIGPGSSTISLTNHNDSSLYFSTSIGYRVVVVDSYTSTTGSSTTVTLLNYIWYGPVASEPTNSTGVRAMSTKIFTDGVNGASWLLHTGSTYRRFTVAMPASLTITEVIDLDALNANITASYINSTFNVNDAYGTATLYNVYTMTNAIAYTEDHRHQITRA